MSENKLGIEVGDIYSSSWGYDQTNVDFYEVVAVTPGSVKIREVDAKIVEGKGLVPAKGHFLEKSHLRRFQDNVAVSKRPSSGYKGQATIKVRSYAWATPWDGEPEYDTTALGYAGH